MPVGSAMRKVAIGVDGFKEIGDDDLYFVEGSALRNW